MKALIIIGSGRKKGNTSMVASLLKRNIEKKASEDGKNVEVEKLFLADYNLKHCLGCRNCMDRGEDKCPLTDELYKIKSKIDAADVIIFGSPVYVDNVSSMMKALIDRLAYICHRQEFYMKSAFVYSTSGGSSTKKTNNTIVGALLSWGFNFLGRSGFIISHHDTKEETEKKYKSSLAKISKKVYRSMKQKSFRRPSIISLAIFKLQQRERANPEKAHPLDYKYWKERGWDNPKINYYSEHQTGIPKLILSRILYRTISLLFVKN